MKKYGYLPEKEEGMDFAYTPHALHTEALKKMQEFAGLTPTGHLDAETRKVSNRLQASKVKQNIIVVFLKPILIRCRLFYKYVYFFYYYYYHSSALNLFYFCLR